MKINKDKDDYWRDRLYSLKKFRVGIVYSGLLNCFFDKDIPLQLFKSLIDLDIDIICLHKKDDLKGIDTIDFKDSLHIYEEIDQDKPFEDTIAIINNIDLLLTVDTCTTYLGGIMGKDTLLMSDYYSDWVV